jgi:CheY-like chemotaxis protein
VAPTRAAQGAGEARELSQRRILVVDDEQPILDGMSALLRGWGAEVIARQSTREALEALPSGVPAPDLIVADYQLRDGEVGTETIRAVRARCGREVPAIMITGSTTPERFAEARQGRYHLLLKPVMPARLRTLIEFKLRQPEAALR